MSGIKRYILADATGKSAWMERDDDGDYVLYSDHVGELATWKHCAAIAAKDANELQAEVARLRAEVEKVRGYEVAPLEAKVAELSAQLRDYQMAADAEANEVDRRGKEIKSLRNQLEKSAKAALDAVSLACQKEREADALRAELAEANDRFEKFRHDASKDYAALFARKDACANDVAIYKDAQRYRWLRAGSGTTWDQPWVAVGHCDIDWVRQPNEIEGKQLDSAIDAALGEA